MNAALDFSVLDALTKAGRARNPAEPQKECAEGKALPIAENAPEGEQRPVGGNVYYKLEAEERKKAAADDAQRKQIEAYKAYQDAIRKAGQRRADITKGILAGEEPLQLLLQAIECIALMTGDDTFYRQGKDNIKAVYGVSEQ